MKYTKLQLLLLRAPSSSMAFLPFRVISVTALEGQCALGLGSDHITTVSFYMRDIILFSSSSSCITTLSRENLSLRVPNPMSFADLTNINQAMQIITYSDNKKNMGCKNDLPIFATTSTRGDESREVRKYGLRQKEGCHIRFTYQTGQLNEGRVFHFMKLIERIKIRRSYLEDLLGRPLFLFSFAALIAIMAANVKKRVLLIGAGPTSSLISYNITKNRNLKDVLDIHVWEKARGVGGRFSTSRSSRNPECIADLGAQYLTLSEAHGSSKHYFDNLKQHNLIRPLETQSIPGFRPDPTKTHFACVNGTASIVKHFFEQASITGADICFNRRVIKINFTPESNVEVVTEDNAKDSFDLVVSTMPASQLLQLENFEELVADSTTKQNLEAVKYSTRFALGLFFDDSIKLKSASHPLNFVNDSIIRYWSIENLKRKGKIEGPTSVVMHTSIDFGERNIDKDKEAMKPQLLQKAIELIPEAAGISNELVKSHKWRYSQVMKPYNGLPGCIMLNDKVLAAGDGFSGSGFEGCIDSAEKTVLAIKSVLNL